MTAYRAIIDTQALVYIAKLDQKIPVRELLPNIFQRLLVPQEVAKEFNQGLIKNPEGFAIADAIDQGGFLEKCTAFDTGTLLLMQATPKVDPGEAEAAAQHQAVDSNFIWSDDKAFRAAVLRLSPNVKVVTTLHVVAMLDLLKYLLDFPSFVEHLHSVRPVNEGNFVHCYRETARMLGINMSQKELIKKIDFKAFGIK